MKDALEFFNKSRKVAIKVANPEIIHKSDAGMVILNINSIDELEMQFPQLKERIKKYLPPNIKPKILLQKIEIKIELCIGR